MPRQTQTPSATSPQRPGHNVLAREPQVACANCEWCGRVEDLKPARDLAQRLDPGGEVPAGECPKCGCLAYIVRPIIRPPGE